MLPQDNGRPTRSSRGMPLLRAQKLDTRTGFLVSIGSVDFVGSPMDEFGSAISQLAGQSRAAFAGCLSS